MRLFGSADETFMNVYFKKKQKFTYLFGTFRTTYTNTIKVIVGHDCRRQSQNLQFIVKINKKKSEMKLSMMTFVFVYVSQLLKGFIF